MRPYVIVDVGARWGISDRWESLAPEVRVFGFDPDVNECERLNQEAAALGKNFVRYVPVALGDSAKSVTLYNTVEPACSSIYRPIPELAETFTELGCTGIIGGQTIVLETLDEWCSTNEIGDIDFLKLDIQGAELDVLRGASATLASVSMLEVEVEFNPIYEGQPLFGDVDAYLRSCGFSLWRLDHLVHYSLAPPVAEETLAFFDSVPITSPRPGGQIYWGHAFYVRASMCLGADSLDADERSRLARLAEASGLADLAAHLGSSPVGVYAHPYVTARRAAETTELVVKQDALEGASRELVLKQEAIESLVASIGMRDAQISAQAAEISAQAAEISAQAAEISAQAAEISAQAAEISAVRNELDRLLGSRSWRLSRPIRGAIELLSSRRH